MNRLLKALRGLRTDDNLAVETAPAADSAKKTFTCEYLPSDEAPKTIILSGIIDEHADCKLLASRIHAPVTIDVAGVHRLNSLGIQAWIELTETISPHGPHRLRRCPTAFINQITIYPKLIKGLTVDSLLLPYNCQSCAADETNEVDLTQPNPFEKSYPCGECGADLVLDDVDQSTGILTRAFLQK